MIVVYDLLKYKNEADDFGEYICLASGMSYLGSNLQT